MSIENGIFKSGTPAECYVYERITTWVKIKIKHDHPIILIQTNKMLHFLPNYFFCPKKNNTENVSETRHHEGSHAQTKNMKCYSSVTFLGIHINKMHRDKPSRKKRESRHIPTPHVDSARHSDVTHVTLSECPT